MRRVLWFLDWKSKWWVDHADQRTDTRVDVEAGLSAYANKQAAILLEMGKRFAFTWYPMLVRNGLPTEWPEEFVMRDFELAGDLETMEAVIDDADDVDDDIF